MTHQRMKFVQLDCLSKDDILKEQQPIQVDSHAYC